MRKIQIVALFSAALAMPFSVYAAKPVKISPGNIGNANGAEFRNYTVECSNGKKQPITSWDNGKKWCVGQESQENCAKKQIKAAKSACKLG